MSCPDSTPPTTFAEETLGFLSSGRNLSCFQDTRPGRGCKEFSVAAGIRALLVHALNEQAKAFYLGHGFIASPIEPMTFMLSLAQSAHDCWFSPAVFIEINRKIVHLLPLKRVKRSP